MCQGGDSPAVRHAAAPVSDNQSPQEVYSQAGSNAATAADARNSISPEAQHSPLQRAFRLPGCGFDTWHMGDGQRLLRLQAAMGHTHHKELTSSPPLATAAAAAPTASQGSPGCGSSTVRDDGSRRHEYHEHDPVPNDKLEQCSTVMQCCSLDIESGSVPKQGNDHGLQPRFDMPQMSSFKSLPMPLTAAQSVPMQLTAAHSVPDANCLMTAVSLPTPQASSNHGHDNQAVLIKPNFKQVEKRASSKSQSARRTAAQKQQLCTHKDNPSNRNTSSDRSAVKPLAPAEVARLKQELLSVLQQQHRHHKKQKTTPSEQLEVRQQQQPDQPMQQQQQPVFVLNHQQHHHQLQQHYQQHQQHKQQQYQQQQHLQQQPQQHHQQQQNQQQHYPDYEYTQESPQPQPLHVRPMLQPQESLVWHSNVQGQLQYVSPAPERPMQQMSLQHYDCNPQDMFQQQQFVPGLPGHGTGHHQANSHVGCFPSSASSYSSYPTSPYGYVASCGVAENCPHDTCAPTTAPHHSWQSVEHGYGYPHPQAFQSSNSMSPYHAARTDAPWQQYHSYSDCVSHVPYPDGFVAELHPGVVLPAATTGDGHFSSQAQCYTGQYAQQGQQVMVAAHGTLEMGAASVDGMGSQSCNKDNELGFTFEDFDCDDDILDWITNE